MADAVVTLTTAGDGVAQLTMCDTASKNSFSDRFIADLQRQFEAVSADDRYRVVVLTGYAQYFSCGGTKDELMSIHRRELSFDRFRFYRAALDCELPVVAAMQGHAIGGGVVLGLYADAVVLGRENVYTANFMRYGFTPGLGATVIVPEKLGTALAAEMLLTGETYRGEELARRGVPYPVVPRADVLAVAMRLARALADRPRAALVTLKRHLTGGVRARLDRAVEQELQMHRETFHRPEVAQRIESLFGR
jgi:polyketide biosynthesis enoyl-CoA hydratase PksI